MASRESRRAGLLEAQAARLEQLADFLDEPVVARPDPDAKDRTISALAAIVRRIYARRDDRELWLAIVAMAGVYPTVDDMERAIATRDGSGRDTFFDWFIPATSVVASAAGSADRLRFVTGGVIVDVDSCARTDRHTGIQRVERETMPRWVARHELELVAWTDRDGGLRALEPEERRRVLEWSGRDRRPSHGTSGDSQSDLIVPLDSVVVLPEVVNVRAAPRLAALARWSGNRVTAIGYDVIPLSSPDLLPHDAGPDFLTYLHALWDADVVAGISRSATEEFRGYFTAVGDRAPSRTRLVTCELPTDVPPSERDVVVEDDGADPLVLCVGSHEPRKNHGAVLHAAELLWREGHRFRLEFLGGGGWGTDFDIQAEQLRKRGRALELRKGVSDAVLWDTYRRARFTVFPSLHEGFGLPVAESLAFGTPVVTSDYGSTREIGERGGCLLVDPRNDAQLHDAMRRLLVDDELHDALSAEARAIEVRSWDDYAEDLWTALVTDVR
jgi:glycosyltransferase involved in cell wall biosynthesis